MRLLVSVFVALMLSVGCVGSSPGAGVECSEDRLAEWEIHVSWCQRRLTPTQAEREVLTGSLPVDGIRDRWDRLRAQWRDGDQYWLYIAPEERWINAAPGERGVVLLRDCRQIGSVATSIGSAGSG